nr:uncharacterized protein LOC110365253 isoform X24 [Columba livia]
MGLSLQRLAQLCAMSESTETRVISNVNCRLLNYFKPSYDSKSSMILKEMGRVFTNWFCPPPAYEEELSDTRAEVQHALSSPDAGGRSRLLVSNRRLLQHSGTSRSGHCWAPEEFGTGHAPPAGSSQHPAALSSSELPCSRRSRAPGPELQDGIAQSNETRSVPCHRQKGDGVAAVTEEDRQYLKNQQLQRTAEGRAPSRRCDHPALAGAARAGRSGLVVVQAWALEFIATCLCRVWRQNGPCQAAVFKSRK